MLRTPNPKSYLYSVKRYYLFLCFGTSQYHLCYQVVLVLSLLHSIIDGVHSERTYKFQLLAYDLPTCPSTLSVFIFFRCQNSKSVTTHRLTTVLVVTYTINSAHKELKEEEKIVGDKVSTFIPNAYCLLVYNKTIRI